MSQEKTLVLVDGSALAFRSFYALFTSGLRKRDGTATWAVYGFFKALFDLVEKQKPDMIAVCFDMAEPTFRHKEYDEYKANRTEMPDDLAVQWPIIKEGVEAFSIPVYELAGWEADDIIGTIAKKAGSLGHKVTILTGDQDAFQLLDKDIQVLMPGKMGLTVYGRNEVFEKLGVWPEQVIDYKGLCGDTSDNIPGVRGIGPKTAVQLLSRFETMENVYQHIDDVGSASVKKKLEEGRDSAFFSKGLATIRLNVPIEFDFEHCHLTPPDTSRVVKFFEWLESKAILKILPKVLERFGVDPLETLALTQSPNAVPNASAAAVVNPVGISTTSSAVAGGIGVSALAESGASGAAAANGSVSVLEKQVFGSGSEPASLPGVNWTRPEPVLVRDKERLAWLEQELKDQKLISIDLETTGLDSLDTNIVGFAFAWIPGLSLNEFGELVEENKDFQVKTVYVPTGHFLEPQLDLDEVIAVLKPILENDQIGKIAQNGKFEMNVLSQFGIHMKPLAFDPMLASYVTNPDSKHGLKDQSENLLGYSMVRISELIGEGRKQITMDKVQVSQAAPYAADDARVALELTRYYAPQLDAEQREVLYKIDQPVSAVLAKMEQTGVKLDLPYLKKFSQELGVDLTRLEQEIYGFAGHSFNINSTQQLQKVLFEELKLPTKAKTKSGYSTDASVLEALRDEHEIIAKLLDYRQLTKLRSTYVDALPKLVSAVDGRVHGEFNLTGTSTGRLSSSNPNLQNIPIRTEAGRRIRTAFIPSDENSVIISADYSQIELRLLAHMSQDATLMDAFHKDQDIHARTAMEIFEVPMEAVTSDMRRVGKTINFSLVYQQGAYSTAQDLGISMKEAQAFIDKYFSRYPQVRGFIASTLEDARETGYVKTIYGRKRYFRSLNNRNDQERRAAERAAFNAPLQGSAADLMKLAMLELDKQLELRKLRAKLILQVHDELVLDVPESEKEDVMRIVVDAMTLNQPFSIPLKVDVRAGKTWMDAK